MQRNTSRQFLNIIQTNTRSKSLCRSRKYSWIPRFDTSYTSKLSIYRNPVQTILAKSSFTRHLTTTESPEPPPLHPYPINPPKDTTEGEYKSTKKHLKLHQSQLSKLQNSKKVVQVAIFSNSIIFVTKLYGFVTSNSATMFAESMHSMADIFNQMLLMMGVVRSLRQPDYLHPYGYEGEKYAWAMLSGVGVFFLGGGVTLYHGIMGLFDPAELQDITPALIALGGCAVFDLASFSFAFTNIRNQAKQVNMGFIPYLVHSADPSSVQVMMEDSAALTGVCLAGLFIILSKYLQMPVFDAIGSISIGILLSFVGVFLIRRNMHNLLGKRMDLKKEEQIINIIQQQPTVKSVHNVKTTSIGPDWSRFKGKHYQYSRNSI